MTMDFNSAGEQMNFDALPSGTLVKLGFSVKAGGAGADGSLTDSKNNSQNKMLALECTIISQPYGGRKVFERWVVEGNQQACEISRSKIRALLNSCRGIDPKANDPQSASGRVLNSYGEVHGMVAAARLGIEQQQGRDPQNKIATIIEPGGLNYNEIMAGQSIPAQPAQGAQAAPAPAAGGWQAPGAAPAPAPAAAPAQQWAPPAQPLAAQGGTPDASQMPGVSFQQPAQQQWTPPAAGQPAQANPGTQPAPQPQEQASAAPAWAQQPQQ